MRIESFIMNSDSFGLREAIRWLYFEQKDRQTPATYIGMR